MAQAYIVDASALVQAFVEDSDSARAKTMVFETFGGSVELHVPEFGLIECTNILWKRIMFQGLALTDAEASRAALLGVPMQVYPASDFTARALEIAAQHRLAVYDSIYLALAETVHHPIITADGNQAKIARQLGLGVHDLGLFPEYTV